MKIQLSLTALILSSSLALAGGDLAPIEPEIIIPTVPIMAEVIPEPEPQKSGVYIGLGYSCMQMTADTPDEEYMGDEVSGNIGYKFNENLALEARYTHSIGDINYKRWDKEYDIADSSLSNLGIYLKPQLNLAGLGLYALIGYGQVKIEDATDAFTENTFQYGVGTSFDISEVTMFVDYRRLYDGEGFAELTRTQDVAVNSFTVGLNYEF
jgi:opacity protein-like surface antigen